MATVEPDSFSWTHGEEFLKTYASKQGLGIAFCGNCGSTLVGLYNSQVMGVTLGTLNDDAKIRIDYHLFVESKAQWDEIGGQAPQFAEWPERRGE